MTAIETKMKEYIDYALLVSDFLEHIDLTTSRRWKDVAIETQDLVNQFTKEFHNVNGVTQPEPTKKKIKKIYIYGKMSYEESRRRLLLAALNRVKPLTVKSATPVLAGTEKRAIGALAHVRRDNLFVRNGMEYSLTDKGRKEAEKLKQEGK